MNRQEGVNAFSHNVRNAAGEGAFGPAGKHGALLSSHKIPDDSIELVRFAPE